MRAFAKLIRVKLRLFAILLSTCSCFVDTTLRDTGMALALLTDEESMLECRETCAPADSDQHWKSRSIKLNILASKVVYSSVADSGI